MLGAMLGARSNVMSNVKSMLGARSNARSKEQCQEQCKEHARSKEQCQEQGAMLGAMLRAMLGANKINKTPTSLCHFPQSRPIFPLNLHLSKPIFLLQIMFPIQNEKHIHNNEYGFNPIKSFWSRKMLKFKMAEITIIQFK